MSTDRKYYRQVLTQRLRLCRFNSRRSAKSVASAIGVHFNTLLNYEKGVSYLPAELLPILANIYGVSIRFLLREDEGPPVKLPNFLKIKDRLNAKRKDSS